MEFSSIIDYSKLRVPLLKEENYYIWSKKIELILRGKALSEIVTGEENSPSTTDSTSESGKHSTSTAVSTVAQKYQQRKDTALMKILLTIEDTCLSHVIGDLEPNVVWD